MRTTVRLSDALLRGAKKFAAEHDTTLTELLDRGLRMVLREKSAKYRPRGGKKKGLKLTYFNDGGMRPGIDPTSNASMMDAADGLNVPGRR